MEKIATRQAYGKALVELGQKNEDIVVLDADLAKSTMTIEFGKRFPQRFFDMGVAEQNLLGTAAGLAAGGKIPFASSFAVFATGRAYDQIRNSIAYPRLNVKIAATHAGITVGEDGASHQMLEDIALMRALPNMTVLVPADAVETRKAVFSAVEYEGPVYIRLGRPALPIIYDDSYCFRLGKASVLKEGDDVTIVSCGVMVSYTLEAAKKLQEEGISAHVINMSTIKPFDASSLIESVRKTGAVVTAEEHSIIGGLGSAVSEVISEQCPVPLFRIGVNDQFGESGPPQQLMDKYGLNIERIVEAAKMVLKKKHK